MNVSLDLTRKNSGFESQPEAFSGSFVSGDNMTGNGAIDSNNLDVVMDNRDLLLVIVRGRSASSDVSSDNALSLLYIPPPCR